MLETPRLILRPWKESDYPAFAALNTDARVREYFYHPATIESSLAMAKRLQRRIVEHGYGLWAVELKETGSFIGFTGLAPVLFTAHFVPATEIAWRLAPHYWGKGYATEAAMAALEDGFQRIGLEQIIAYTLPHNHASRRIMEKLGMRHYAHDDFDHPEIPTDHPQRRMVLYRFCSNKRA